MNLQEISAFVTLAEELHFTRTAERLGIGQPQVSQLIRRLEKECGDTLVERTTRSVSLTALGQAVLPHAQRALREMRLIRRSGMVGGAEIMGVVRLGYAGASSRPWLPAIARAVRQKAPGVDLQLRSMVYGATGPGLVVCGDLEMAFSRRPLVHSGLQDRIFEYEKILVGVPSDHHLAACSEVHMRDLRNEPWVTFPGMQGSNVRDVGMRLAAEAGFVPRVVQEAPDSYTILGLVAAGVGVTVTVSSVQHVSTPGLRLIQLAGGPHFVAATIVWPLHASRATQAVLEAIAQVQPAPERPAGILME